MKKSRIDKIYTKVQNKHPDIHNAEQIELLVRKRIFRKKLLICFLIYLLAICSVFLLENLGVFVENPDSVFFQHIKTLLHGVAGLGSIGSIMLFAKTMHDPLTPNEAAELQKKETEEKTESQ